jgi:hypothetical protein
MAFLKRLQRLIVVNDFDWVCFAQAVFKADIHAIIPSSFFNHFYWGNIAAKAAKIISNPITPKNK